MQKAQDFFETLLPEAISISRDVSKRFFKKPIETLSVHKKSDASPVTAADLELEERLRECIQKRFPSHGIIGEEHGTLNGDAEFVWVLDPIDGTKSFISGVPLFTTLVALLHQGAPQCGAIYQPVLDELVWGNNHECFFNGKKTQMRETQALSDATLLVTDLSDVKKYQPKAAFESLAERVRFFRTWADGYGYALLATGYADIMIDPIMNPWDLMAVIPVIRGAGGTITDFENRDAAIGNSIVAAHPNLHKETMRLLRYVE